MISPALEVRGIQKWFGDNHASRNISLSVEKGSIHGLVGENGAGKSTLMNIVYGFIVPDAGEIFVSGRNCVFRSPRDAISSGIGMVHQHFMLVEPFTVLENVLLGAEGGPLLRRSRAHACEQLISIQKEYGLDVNIHQPVQELPVGIRQRVEILKALLRGADILILDEPTGVLTPQEADDLFRILRTLRDQGKTIIIITHKLREIMILTDHVTVMRRGAVVGSVTTADTTREALAEMMVGRTVLLRLDKAPAKPGPVLLEARGLCVAGQGAHRSLRGIDLDVRAGEIVGIAGVSGNGQTELMEALAGMCPLAAGEIRLRGKAFASASRSKDAAAARVNRIAHVPEDRQRDGLVTSFPAYMNFVLGYHRHKPLGSGLFYDWGRVRAVTQAAMAEFNVRPQDPTLTTSHFSGGNQQKLILAREIGSDPDVLLVGQPTRGVDIGAIEYIHRRLIELRDAGKAILLISVELDEILSLSDRIFVIFDGSLMGEFDRDLGDERQLGLMMAGVARS